MGGGSVTRCVCCALSCSQYVKFCFEEKKKDDDYTYIVRSVNMYCLALVL